MFLHEDTPFPSVEASSPEGIVAYSGSLTTKRLLAAYKNGIFPWYNDGSPILWWSPDPRMVLFPQKLHVSKNMRRMLRNQIYGVTYNQDFESVINQCAHTYRKNEQGTWIHPEMIEAYTRLHRIGYAHSVEVWQQGTLVGGLYGVRIGNVFCGESMFSHADNASHYGFITFVQQHQDIELIDCQVYTEYLERLGAVEIPRKEYIGIISKQVLK
ncbi:MAG: leucyl/phenylalanyl-tRNA--protein transferase [Capnocytophaga sp.]|nr:leucyl/phenylalanyl-tRNA--protein transferase [Capnocytophaga sp.]